MARYTYPAVFEKEQEGGYSIFFPDVEGCYTQSEDIPEGIENARDALCLMLYEMEKHSRPIPKPRNIAELEAVGDDVVPLITDGWDIVTLITCDTQFYETYFNGELMTAVI